MKVLGIETSCDETAAGVVDGGHTMLSNVVASSLDLHARYGGVVPEIAARSHIEVITGVIDEALSSADCTWSDIDAIAVTNGAGLGGSLLIGVMAARTLAICQNKPLYSANHVEGHVYANFLTDSPLEDYKLSSKAPKFPMLAIIVSGGHSQLVLFHDHFDYRLIGQTQDDAIGEAFDKVAKMIGLPYPGGPAIAKLAQTGDPLSYTLPIAKMPGYDFSFSGPKTAVLRLAQSLIGESYDFPSYQLPGRLSEVQKANIAASFQRVAATTITAKAKKAYLEFDPKSVVLAGGVAANLELRDQLASALQVEIIAPDIKLCTDNGAMIASLGCYKIEHNQEQADPYALSIAPNLSM